VKEYKFLSQRSTLDVQAALGEYTVEAPAWEIHSMGVAQVKMIDSLRGLEPLYWILLERELPE
jgi:hypothetical protein